MSNVTNTSSLLSFIKNFLNSIINSIKLVITFFQNIFNPSYYQDIFSFLPTPFNTILISLVGIVMILAIMYILDKVLRLIK